MLEAQVTITNPTGLHARPAVKLAQLAAGFAADVEVRVGESGDWVRARSTARVMKLKATAQSIIRFRAEGEQAADALAALVDLVRRDFDEGPGALAQDLTLAGTEEPIEALSVDKPPVPDSEGRRIVPATVASPGLAIGVIHRLQQWHDGRRDAGDERTELTALDAAIERAIQQLNELANGKGTLAGDLISFQLSLLQDQEFLDPVRRQIAEGKSVERAWADHLADEITDYESAETSYLRDRAADLRDLRDRVSMAFVGGAQDNELPDGAILFAEELTPSRFLEVDWDRAVGAVTNSGSTASHTAMLARARGVPMLVQLACEAAELGDGVEAVIDGDRGSLVLGPSQKALQKFAKRIEEHNVQEQDALIHLARPARTRGGLSMRVLVNIDSPSLLSIADPGHCDGIGLTRTELLFHGGKGLPDEETQFQFYKKLIGWAQGRPVTIRTLDAGGDKPIPNLTLDGESNPFLGLRGIRLSLAKPDVLRTQLRALARAAAVGDIKVMIPMVTLESELLEVRRLMQEECSRLLSEGVSAKMPSIGMMVEVPAAALTIEKFDADFYSIGTNDLTQYLLAASRDSKEVAQLLDPTHPAVIELIARVAAHGASTGKDVSICGEMAAQPLALRTLVDAGIRTLSVPPAALASTKAALANL